ncbi:hypothetical protein BLNAU_23690 [Blattamonas nauphoetae]|uniref:Uncharacterized protein n=1 Tax=Blattamonas nauphoetae TaxID=2049346 RepID=A0ABQ9WRL4_9EUKA|nr:hypothetical protein BLNAU_23690 [Blattamonas nauphoetae]
MRPDCSAFLNWNEEELESEHEMAVVFRSLVATMKLQPALNDIREAKAVKFLKSLDRDTQEYTDALFTSLASFSDESLTGFVQSIVVLISSPSQAITTATMKMLRSLIVYSSAKVRIALIEADLIPQIVITLNPLSLSFAEAVDIHINVTRIIFQSLWLATPGGLTQLKLKDRNEQQDVHETVFQQVLFPSEKYIWHLCVNLESIVDGEQSSYFLFLLARLLKISPYYQQ